jgi:hypothetical protein
MPWGEAIDWRGCGSVWLLDVRPMNFVESSGELYPIDVIVVFERP